MYQTPIKLNTQNFSNFLLKNSDLDACARTEGFLSSRGFQSEPLQFTGSKNLQNLLAEMDALKEEMEQKMETMKSLPESKTTQKRLATDPDQAEQKRYKDRVEDLQSQNSELLRLYAKEEEQHEREKVKIIQAKWREQVQILKYEIGMQGQRMTKKKFDNENRVLKENRENYGQRTRVDQCFRMENRVLEELEEENRRVLCERDAALEEKCKVEREMQELREEMKRIVEENKKMKEREKGIDKEVWEKCREIDGEKRKVLEENKNLKERFAKFQEEQGRVIENISNEMNALVNLVKLVTNEKTYSV